MVAAVNSKSRKYDPVRYMLNGAELKREAREASVKRMPTGEELLSQMRRLGVRIIDKRQGAKDGRN